MMRELEKRYVVRDRGDVGVLVTKEHWRHRKLVTVDARFFAQLVRAWRARAGK